MTDHTVLRMAILTDLHAYSNAPTSPPSWISLRNDQNNPAENPFAGLKHLIVENGLTADAVICCGDIGDKADPQVT